MQNKKLVLLDVSKELAGKKILDNINVSFQFGNIYGIVGENGSGKSMLFRAISGLLSISDGKILIDNEEMSNTNEKIGLSSDDISFYPEYTGYKNLKLIANINKIASTEEIRQALTRVGLDVDDNRLFYKYSLGMKQRLSLAQAIFEKPDILLLDEPTNGIDEEGVKLFYKIAKEEAERGALVIITSHIKSDIQSLAKDVYVMNKGVLKKVENDL